MSLKKIAKKAQLKLELARVENNIEIIENGLINLARQKNELLAERNQLRQELRDDQSP